MKILDCQIDGTPLQNIELLNGRPEFRQFPYRPKFTFSYATGFSLIQEEITAGRPVIVYLAEPHDDCVIHHAIVVTGYSDDLTLIHVNNPLSDGPSDIPSGAFLELWGHIFNVHVRIQVTEHRDTQLTDFGVGV
ncbi:MAG: hypothetical protein K9W43_06505 [Candidatus Thorarchaeota archaeon]|nr:hypothetical protein [Candidatus Thorarchaeota archaeon]